MNSHRLIRGTAAMSVFALAASVFPSWAQDVAAKTPVATSASTAAHTKKHEDFVEKRISDLHGQLKITDAQTSQWDNFAQTMRDNAKRTDDAFHERAAKLATLNADEAMKSYAELAQVHADNMQKLVSAFTALYDVLSDDQKKTADVLFRNRAEKHMHHHASHTKASAAVAASAAPVPAP